MSLYGETQLYENSVIRISKFYVSIDIFTTHKDTVKTMSGYNELNSPVQLFVIKQEPAFRIVFDHSCKILFYC